MTSTVQVKVMDASALKRRMYNWALPVGYAYADAVFRKEAIPASLRLRHRLAYFLVFRALKDRLGLLRIRSASTGGRRWGPTSSSFSTRWAST